MVESGLSALIQLIQELQTGQCRVQGGTVQVQLGPLPQLWLTANQERIDFLHEFCFNDAALQGSTPACNYLYVDLSRSQPLSPTQERGIESETNVSHLLQQLKHSNNLYEHIEILQTLLRLRGADFDTGLGRPARAVTVADLLEDTYDQASQHQLWSVIRRAAGLAGKVDISLSDAVTDILVRQKQIAVGKAYTEASLIAYPMSHAEIMDKIQLFCREDIRDRVLSQEILLYLGLLIKAEPATFQGMLTLRVGHLILLITSELAAERNLPQDEAYEVLMGLSPFEIKQRLEQVLVGYEEHNRELQQQEALSLGGNITWIVQPESNAAEEQPGNWGHKRHQQGMVNRVPKNFYPRVWTLLSHCKGLVIGDKLERRNRMEGTIVQEMTAGEKNFALQVEHLLNKITAPQYRQINIEALMELAALAEANPDLRVNDYIVMDIVIGHAVRLAYLQAHPEREHRYDEFKAEAWSTFYESSPHHCADAVAQALRYLASRGETGISHPEPAALPEPTALPTTPSANSANAIFPEGYRRR
jgi:phosphorylase kinase alpha/beta subunit